MELVEIAVLQSLSNFASVWTILRELFCSSDSKIKFTCSEERILGLAPSRLLLSIDSQRIHEYAIWYFTPRFLVKLAQLPNFFPIGAFHNRKNFSVSLKRLGVGLPLVGLVSIYCCATHRTIDALRIFAQWSCTFRVEHMSTRKQLKNLSTPHSPPADSA